MRIALVAEQFLPHVNGVTHSVIRVLEPLRDHGHEAMVIAPSYEKTLFLGSVDHVDGVRIERIPSLPLAGYPEVRVASCTVSRMQRILARFAPDVVHVASPFVLGWQAIQAAKGLGLPCVAVYQTDVPGYAARYGASVLETAMWSHVRAMHNSAALTLAPSTASISQLHEHGVQRVHMWRRGVDTSRFRPALRDHAWRERVGGGKRLVGYVGRLAPEKQVADLAAIDALPDTRLVIIGSGPGEESLRSVLPNAHFEGFLTGTELATAMASLDVFVHPGEHETFCQTIQEAMASGVPVVAVGRGGPLDLVDSSRNGWLYAPGDLAGLRERVRDLAGDDAKRLAFARTAHQCVQERTWGAVCEQLLGHYERARTVTSRMRGTRRSGLRTP
ncbi:GDP-mannose-dependent alpha-mannosyltransferase [Kocuria marina]|uniref:D-inositol 3-phosphate glycosyltransferase n=1 Tax=Kocuria marina TaxID=223184 RepID=A0A0B0DB21_9MICC|nr:glycosyltransferase family 1 protein [Kocuria marina]KHE74623.1 GDP-mannose-dependent alpha-mannosyltransferase [Kocuria marina]